MSPNPISARDEGLRFLKQGVFAEAVEYLNQAIEEDPEDVDLYEYLGYAYAKQNEFYKSIDTLENAIDLAPTSPKLHYNLGVAYQKVHNMTQAKDEYMRALGLDPAYTAAKNALDALIAAMDQDGMSGASSL